MVLWSRSIKLLIETYLIVVFLQHPVVIVNDYKFVGCIGLRIMALLPWR